MKEQLIMLIYDKLKKVPLTVQQVRERITSLEGKGLNKSQIYEELVHSYGVPGTHCSAKYSKHQGEPKGGYGKVGRKMPKRRH